MVAFLRKADVTPPTAFDAWVDDANAKIATLAPLADPNFTGTVSFGDMNHTFTLVSNQPRWTWDVGDFIRYIRSTNTLQMSFGNIGEHVFEATFYGPASDNANDCGRNAIAWKDVFTVNAVTVTSDERLKTDIADLPVGLDFITRLRPVQYRWKVSERRPRVAVPAEVDEGGNEIEPVQITVDETKGTRTHWGVTAQNVRQALKEAGIYDAALWCLADKDDPDSKQALRETHLIPVLIRAVQELAARVATLEAGTRGKGRR